MFRDIYKQANDDIKADKRFFGDIFDDKKIRIPQKKYVHMSWAAAAVFLFCILSVYPVIDNIKGQRTEITSPQKFADQNTLNQGTQDNIANHFFDSELPSKTDKDAYDRKNIQSPTNGNQNVSESQKTDDKPLSNIAQDSSEPSEDPDTENSGYDDMLTVPPSHISDESGNTNVSVESFENVNITINTVEGFSGGSSAMGGSNSYYDNVSVYTTNDLSQVMTYINDENYKKSDICGNTGVIIRRDGRYQAYVIKGGTGFIISSANISEDKFKDALIDIISQ